MPDQNQPQPAESAAENAAEPTGLPDDLPPGLVERLAVPVPGGPASRAIHEILETAMTDGTVLRADVCRPDDDAAHPVLLTRCPYFGAWRALISAATGSDPLEPGLMAATLGMQSGVGLDRAIEEGFAVVAQSCRGTDRSDGDFRFHVDEASDGVATREALAALPWCDGRIITFGNSYLTTTQYTAALASTEHLAAMDTWVAPSTYDGDLAMRGGVTLEGPSYDWARQQVAAGLARDGRPDADPAELPLDVDDFTPWLREVGLAEAARRLAAAHVAGSHVVDWDEHRLHDEYWERLVYPEEGLEALDVPVLHVSGWYDLFEGGTLRNAVATARGAEARGRTGDARLVVGPWTHVSFDRALPGREFPHGATTDAGLPELTLDFWKASLGDAEAAARLPKEPVRLYLMGADRWIDLPAWPAPDAVDTAWRLSDAGTLLAPDDDGPAAGWTSWHHDPTDPVPTEGGQLLMGAPENAGPHDQRGLEARPDVAAFTGPELTEPLTVLGPVRLTAWVAVDAEDAHLHAALTDVAPDGTSTLLTDGVLRLSARRGTERHDAMLAGEPVEVEVDMWATGAHLPAGHRVRLDLSGSSWPRYAVADPADGAPVEITIRHDAEHPSALHLPVIEIEDHPGVAASARPQGS